MQIYIYVTLFKNVNLIHHGPRHQSQTSLLVVHPTSQVYFLGYPAPSVQTVGALLLGQVAETPWSCCGGWITGTGCGCGVGMASLGISWMQKYSCCLVLALHPTLGCQVCNWGGSFSSPESVSGVSLGISSNIRHQWTPSQDGRLLGHLGVKGEIRHWAVVKSARSKEASVVNTEYMQIGLVISGGSP